MAILDRTKHGLHSVLIVLYSAVKQEGEIPKSRLLDLCAPRPIVKDRKHVNTTLRRWTDLGLFKSSPGDIIGLSDDLPVPPGDDDSTVGHLPYILRKLLFRRENNLNLWDKESSIAADFTRALAWLLAQDVYRLDVANTEITSLAANQISGKESPFRIDREWFALKLQWGPYLGFGYLLSPDPPRPFVIDPTTAIKQSLPDVFGDQEMLSIEPFLSRLSTELPVLDGGLYRLEVERKIDRKYWQAPEPPSLSSSLSRALIRLKTAGTLELLDRDDSPAWCFVVGLENTRLERVTDIRYRRQN